MGQNKLLGISDELVESVANFRMPENLGFGKIKAPLMARAVFEGGQWSEPEIVACETIELDPFCKTFHYGQQIFEGMKAYRRPDQSPALFRWVENFHRFNVSAERMAMPSLDKELFSRALKSLVHHLIPIIPTGFGESLYLRPLMFALDEGLSLGHSERYLFLILASPSAAYFQTAEVKALIERENCRAAPGGTGFVKVAGNYGASIRSALVAKQLGYQQTLWLDGLQKRYIEEFSGMNFFAVIDDSLVTPELTDTILPGITRNSLIWLAKQRGISVREEKLDIDLVLESISTGQCSEIFACGTAAVVSPIAALGEKNGKLYELPKSGGKLTKMLGDTLVSIQYQMESAPASWVDVITPDSIH
ncbi:MAG: branched-chain amino acid aminotransferase [Oligoflexus sp.]